MERKRERERDSVSFFSVLLLWHRHTNTKIKHRLRLKWTENVIQKRQFNGLNLVYGVFSFIFFSGKIENWEMRKKINYERFLLQNITHSFSYCLRFESICSWDNLFFCFIRVNQHLNHVQMKSIHMNENMQCFFFGKFKNMWLNLSISVCMWSRAKSRQATEI